MAFVTDPTGAAVGLWQANQHIGATLVDEAGAVMWNELITDKPETALAFCEAVLGITHATMEMAPGQTYNVLKAGGNDVGGCMEPPMPGMPNHWHVYFAVDDADATAAQADRAGRPSHRRTVRHPVGGAVRAVGRPPGRDVQRVETRTSAIGRLPVTGPYIRPRDCRSLESRPCTVGSTS